LTKTTGVRGSEVALGVSELSGSGTRVEVELAIGLELYKGVSIIVLIPTARQAFISGDSATTPDAPSRTLINSLLEILSSMGNIVFQPKYKLQSLSILKIFKA
jgi:hypothetical protein